MKGQLIFYLFIRRSPTHSRSFSRLKALIIEYGGRIVDLDEPQLTHIVIDKRDTGRRLELMRRTTKYVNSVLHIYGSIV